MKLQQKLFPVFTLVGLAAMPVFGQMPGMPSGSKMPNKSTPTKAPSKNIAMCCMSGMKMDKMMSGLSAADKKKTGMCCMAGMKAAGMKPGSKGMPGGMGAKK